MARVDGNVCFIVNRLRYSNLASVILHACLLYSGGDVEPTTLSQNAIFIADIWTFGMRAIELLIRNTVDWILLFNFFR